MSNMGLTSSHHRLVSAPTALLSIALVGGLGGCLGPEPNGAGDGSGGAGTTSSSSTTTGMGPGSSGSSGSTKASSGVGTSSSQSGSGGEGGFTDVGTGTGGAGGAGGGGGLPCDPLGDDPLNCGACGRACSAAGVAGDPVCTAGECTPVCKPFRFDLNQPGDEPDDGCETTGKRVFVTDEPVVAGGLDPVNGVQGHDDLCQQAAEAAQLAPAGSWLAWLSEQNDEVETRFSQADVPYVLLDGTTIANGWDDLTDGELHQPIHITEAGVDLLQVGNIPAIAQRAVWTGTQADGKATDARCLEWASASAEQMGDVGAVMTAQEQSVNGSEGWTSFTARPCNMLARLYCFEQ